MAWRQTAPSGQLDDIHAGTHGSGRALCGEPVDTFGPAWPFPQQEWAELPEDRQPCRYCLRLVYDD